MSLVEELMKTATSRMSGAAAQKTGLNENMAAQLMPMAMAVLMKGIGANAKKPEGAQALNAELDKHDGALLDDLERAGDDDVMADGGRILEALLGSRREEAEAQIAKLAGGVDKGQVNAVLKMAAPALLGALGKAKKDQGLGEDGVVELVKSEEQMAAAAAPGELSGVLKYLDADGDGDLTDEAMGLGKRLLGGLFGKK